MLVHSKAFHTLKKSPTHKALPQQLGSRLWVQVWEGPLGDVNVR